MADPAPLRADAVVIGSGAGGAPVAALLAEAGLDVLLLEAGPWVRAGEFGEDESEATARLGTLRTTRDGAMTFYAGSCVGGSTVVNDALCWRTPPEVLAHWRGAHGLSDFEDDAFAPWLDRAWTELGAEATLRSHLNRNAWMLERGARRLGWAAEAMPRNVKGCAGLGRCNLGCPIDAKQSALVSYVPRAERAGARVLPDAPVQRIRVESGAVVGVEALRLDPRTRRPVGPLTVESRLVCVAAGVLGSAALLLRSGIGGSAPGEGLQVHSTVHVAARFEEPVHAYLGPTMAYAVTEWSDVNGRRGPGFMLENVPAHPLVTASALPGFGDELARAMDALPHLARCAVLVRDRTRGRVRVDDAGRPRFEYALDAGDLERLRAGMQAAARLYLAAGAEEVWLPLNGSPPVRSEADLRHLASWPVAPSRLSFLYAVHLFGGAAMDGSASGVCDPEGACRGIRGLYVSDAAALPGNTGVNPQVTVVANALRIGAGIAARAGA